EVWIQLVAQQLERACESCVVQHRGHRFVTSTLAVLPIHVLTTSGSVPDTRCDLPHRRPTPAWRTATGPKHSHLAAWRGPRRTRLQYGVCLVRGEHATTPRGEPVSILATLQRAVHRPRAPNSTTFAHISQVSGPLAQALRQTYARRPRKVPK